MSLIDINSNNLLFRTLFRKKVDNIYARKFIVWIFLFWQLPFDWSVNGLIKRMRRSERHDREISFLVSIWSIRARTQKHYSFTAFFTLATALVPMLSAALAILPLNTHFLGNRRTRSCTRFFSLGTITCVPVFAIYDNMLHTISNSVWGVWTIKGIFSFSLLISEKCCYLDLSK